MLLKKYSKFQLISESIRNRGLIRTLRIVCALTIDVFFDLRYGTDTFSWADLGDLGIESANVHSGEDYVPTKAIPFLRVLNISEIGVAGDFVDFGCGKGRVLFLAAKYGFRRVVGVEFSSDLCAIAERNFGRWSRHIPPGIDVKILNIDAVDFQFSDRETVFFFFNPFDANVMTQVCRGISDSLIRYPRKAWIIYNNPVHREVLESLELFDNFLEIDAGGNIFFVASRSSPAG